MPASIPGGDGIWRELEALAPTEVSLITERRVTPPPGLAGGAPGAVGRELAAPGRRRVARRAAARQVHRAPRTRRRAAPPHPRWRGMGSADTVRLTEATTSGAASAIPGWKSLSVACDPVDLVGRQLDAPPAAGHPVQPLGDEPRVLVARGIERSRRSSAAAPSTRRGRRPARAFREPGRTGGHRVEHGARVSCRRSRRRRADRRAASRRPACEHARAGPESMPASTSASRSARFARPEPLRLVEHGVARVVEGHAVADGTLGPRHPHPGDGGEVGQHAADQEAGRRWCARRVRARRRHARRGSRPTVGSLRRTGRSRSRPRTCGAAPRS